MLVLPESRDIVRQALGVDRRRMNEHYNGKEQHFDLRYTTDYD